MKKAFALVCILLMVQFVFGQVEDTTTNMIATKNQSYVFETDSLGKDETYSLDIGKNRGLFILTPDKKMQLRLLGSIRFLVLYDFVNYPIKGSFIPYFIPMGDDKVHVPNYYGDLNQSRFGFEVTRALNRGKSVFMRLEMDFSGPSGSFRIRHAYGQFNRLLIGKSWSLFSNVSSFPSTVNFDGPAGGVIIRTPQIRFFGSNKKGTRWAVAMEYSRTDIDQNVFETNNISTVQLIPDFTARIEREGLIGSLQLSGVVTTLSIVEGTDRVNNKFGFGTSLSGVISHKKSKLLYQATYGKSIAHFMTTFSGTGNDAIYNPIEDDIESLYSYGGFVAYDYTFNEKLSANVAFGYASLINKDFQVDSDYSESISASCDVFWNISEGTKMGLEYIYGKRWNISGEASGIGRVAALFYYDF